MEESMNLVYHEIFELISEIIPEPWGSIKLYAQIDQHSGEVYFYYFPIGETTPVYSLDIPKKFRVDKDEFDTLDDKLFDSFKRLWDVFVDHEQEPWTNLTLCLSSEGKLDIQFKYEDLPNRAPYEDRIIWAYEVVGVRPTGDYGIQVLDEYLKRKSG